MNKLIVFCFLSALVVTALAADDGRVMYAGGTVPALPAGAVGRLDTTSEESLTFEYSGTKVLIPYSEIESFEYSTEVTHHLGVMPAIAVGLIKKRQRRHYFRIAYRGADNVSQVVVFEVPKHMPRTLQAVLAVRAPQTCDPRSVCANSAVKTPLAGRH
jgi:hypothetical protein